MYYPDENDPYAQSGQEALPYQPYREYAGPIQYSQQQREVLSPPTTYRSSPGASYNTSARSSQARPTQLRMSKAEALEFVGRCKKWLVAGSFISFGVLSGLVAAHATGVTTPASNSPATSPSSGGNYFQQQQGGGSNFGNNNPFQPPVSGSRVS